MLRDAQGYSEIHRELSGLLKDSQDTLGYFNLPECAQDLGGVSWQPWTTLAHWVYQVAQEAPGFPKGVKVSLGFEVLLLMTLSHLLHHFPELISMNYCCPIFSIN